jgi:hypothetical protein
MKHPVVVYIKLDKLELRAMFWRRNDGQGRDEIDVVIKVIQE